MQSRRRIGSVALTGVIDFYAISLKIKPEGLYVSVGLTPAWSLWYTLYPAVLSSVKLG